MSREHPLWARNWTPDILVELSHHQGAMGVRFNTLLHNIDGISDRVLTIRLRELVDLSLIHI